MRKISNGVMIWVSLTRLLVMGLVGLSMIHLASRQTIQIGWLVGTYGISTLILVGIWWKKPVSKFSIQGVLWLVDVLMAELLLVIFTRPETAAPALLPILAYEAELYWPHRGAVMGGLSVVALLVSAGWLRDWAHRPFLSTTAMIFWIGVLSILIALPQLVQQVTREEATPNTAPIPSVGQGKNLNDDEPEICEVTNNSKPLLKPPPPLSQREHEVCALLCSGVSSEEIAARLVIDLGTVKSHTARIYSKWGVHSRQELQKTWKELNA